MSESIFQLESSNIQNILIALVVICAIVYGFIEFRKINMKLQDIESKLAKVGNLEMLPVPHGFKGDVEQQSFNKDFQGELNNKNELNNQEDQGNQDKPITNSNGEESFVNKIINQVEGTASSMGGLFVSVQKSNIIEEPKSISMNDERIVEINEEEEKDNVVEDVEDVVVEDVEDVEDVVVEDVVVEEPVVEEPVVEEPVAEEPVAEEPVAEKEPTSYTPSDIKNSLDISDPILEVSTGATYEEYTIKDLKNTLEEMGLSTSGNKTKLIERIISNKK